MRKIGILHISDTHIDCNSEREVKDIVTKLIVDIKKVMQENDINIDLICFTGDLINSGNRAKEDIPVAETIFVKPILSALHLSNNEFLLVPGNHEVNTDLINKMSERGLASLASSKDIDEMINDMTEGYDKRLSYYYDYIKENYLTDGKTWNLGYSIIKKVGDTSIGLVGLDSAWRSTGKGIADRGKMLVGESQIDVLYDNVMDTDFKICLMHHPLDWLSELEMDSVEKKLNKFDLVLRGHVHDLDDKQICRQNYKTIYNTAGKLYPVDQYYSGYSLISIDMNFHKCKIFSREYLHLPKNNFDKALRINDKGYAEYFLKDYDEEQVMEIDLRNHLCRYFNNATEKHILLKNVDNRLPERLCDFYVDPIILDRPEHQVVNKDKLNVNRLQLDELIVSGDNIAIIGKRESGKTTVLYKFGLKLTEQGNNKIPIYIDMHNLNKGRNKLLNACQRFIMDNLSDNCRINKEQISKLLENGKIVFLIDNVDTSTYKDIQDIERFSKEFFANRFIFALTESVYQSLEIRDIPSLGVDCKKIYLQYFGKHQIREMVTKWGNSSLGFNPDDMTNKIVKYCDNIKFAKSPFNIVVIMTIWDSDRTFVPINEGKVMETYLNIVLDKFSSDDFQRSEYGFDHKQHFLGCLAHTMYEKGKYMLTEYEFNEMVNFYHKELGAKISKTKFDIIFFEKNILCREEDSIYFTNTSIMKYCLAYYASINSAFYDLMIKKGNRRKFIDELSFYSGIVKDCSSILKSLNEEITTIIIDNMDVVDEIEDMKIQVEFDLSKNNLVDTISKDRKSMKEIDEMYDASVLYSENESAKIETWSESESFMDLLTIYGNTIKNAEIISAAKKKLHLDTYILGMNLQLSIVIKILSSFIKSESKEELPDNIKNEYPLLTDEAFDRIKENMMDWIKIALPIGIQFFIADNVGTPKLEVVIEDMIGAQKIDNKFTKFMLVFLLSDISDKVNKKFLMDYINNEDSNDILKIVFIKITFYYYFRYYGESYIIDKDLMDLLTEVKVKLMKKELLYNSNKAVIKNELEKKYSKDRNKCGF